MMSVIQNDPYYTCTSQVNFIKYQIAPSSPPFYTPLPAAAPYRIPSIQYSVHSPPHLTASGSKAWVVVPLHSTPIYLHKGMAEV